MIITIYFLKSDHKSQGIMDKLSLFWTPVNFDNTANTPSQKVLQKVDNCFYMGGKKAKVIKCHKNKLEIILIKGTQPVQTTARKVAFLCIFFFPLLIAKVILRFKYKFSFYSNHGNQPKLRTDTQTIFDPKEEIEKPILERKEVDVEGNKPPIEKIEEVAHRIIPEQLIEPELAKEKDVQIKKPFIHPIEKNILDLENQIELIEAEKPQAEDDIDLSNPENAIFEAINRNKLDVLKKVITPQNINNLIEFHEMTALSLAASKGYNEIVEFLLNSGADIALSHPLGHAVRWNHLETVKLLVERKADVNASGFDFRCHARILDIAIANGFTEIVQFLLSKDAKCIEQKNCTAGVTPFHEAIAAGHTEVVRLLLEAEIDIKDDAKGNMPLHWAVNHNRLEIVKLLLTQPSTNINAKNKTREWHPMPDNTPLHQAVKNGFYDIVKILIEHHADVNLPNAKDLIPPELAVLNGDLRILKLFSDSLKKNENLKFNLLCLTMGIRKNNPEILDFFNGLGVELPQHLKEANITFMHLAAASNNPEVLKKFLLPNINAKTSVGNTPLSIAIDSNSEETAKFLIENNADISLDDEEQNLPIHLAVNSGNLKLVQLIAPKRLDLLNQKNGANETALEIAQRKGFQGIIDYLINLQ